ncbi:aminopeptidase N [Arthrobacter pityocampae]|uniref:Aminopeptidase N n=1 Tax=Arthrobacter pityocampae TaxID=547334 RepID=A0A2S5IZP0_9MICC|nr:aminopeptidase N [Arthrobacter pityocampae]PPB50003.1 aminopeptidase N [Arthrobacter pityocampae]
MENENLTRDEAAARSALLETESYTVHLDLSRARDADEDTYPTTTTVVFSCREPGASTFLDFIGEVTGLEVNGRVLDPATAGDGARVLLHDLADHNTVTLTGRARYSTSGEGLHRFVDPADGETYLYTQYEPADARRVFANFEQPDLKATFAFSVVAPADWTVASNGAETGVEPRTGDYAEAGAATPTARWTFAPTRRISTYITTVLAGPYHRETDAWAGAAGTAGEGLEVPLALYCRRSLAPSFDAPEIFDTTRRGLDFFHDLFDYPYPFGKYDQAFVPEYNLGAMENPGLVTFTENYVFRSAATEAQREARANTIMHEMAHMWFGDLVTMSWWDDLWLKESFADYMGALAVAEATRWSTSWVSFANRRKSWAYVQDQLPTTHPIVADIPDLEAAKQNFDGITYAKGASVLKQLVAFVGREDFTAAARQYFRKHEYRNTTLADLLDVLSVATGRDLAAWSRSWLQTSGVPALTAEVTADGGVLTGVTIVQDAVDPVTGRDEPRSHRIRVGLYSFDADGWLVRTHAEAVTVDGGRTAVPALAGTAQPDLLLVNDDDLTYAKLSFDERSLATLLTSVHRLQDPLARATCLTALWSSTRDARLPVGAYLSAVMLAAPAESGVGVLQVLLANAHTAIERFSPARERPALRERLSGFLADGLRAAAAGSDLQLAWARALATTARSAGRAADVVRAVLDSDERIDGLRLDADLRWSFLQGLAAQQRVLPGELEAERAADPTASGRVGFTLASAALPDAAIKKVTWDEALHGDRLSNELLSAAIEGFLLGPHDLLDPYREPYFEALRGVWATRGIEMAGRIVRGLYPGHQDLDGAPDEHAVVLRTDAWLDANRDAPAALLRIIVEERDHLLRALRAQAQGTR